MRKSFSAKGQRQKIFSILIICAIGLFLSHTLSASYAESESKTCAERGAQFEGSTSGSVAKGYELVHMISNPEHSGDIILTLCWITDDEIQVGKLITIDAKASSERYNINNSSHYITITFEKKIINYWEDTSHDRQHEYSTSNELILHQYNTTVFESNPINFRFSVPKMISIEYCEYFPEKDCFNVDNLLQPASYYLDQEIKLNNEIVKLSKQTIELSKQTMKLTCDITKLTTLMTILIGIQIIFQILSRFASRFKLLFSNPSTKVINYVLIVAHIFLIMIVVFTIVWTWC